MPAVEPFASKSGAVLNVNLPLFAPVSVMENFVSSAPPVIAYRVMLSLASLSVAVTVPIAVVFSARENDVVEKLGCAFPAVVPLPCAHSLVPSLFFARTRT